jgi:hypothetical protein
MPNRTRKCLLPYWLSRVALASLLCGLVTGCRSAAKSDATPQSAAKTELVAHETELLKITLSPQAEQRLGIATVAIANGPAGRVRHFHGEIVVAPTGGGLPIASTTDLSILAAAQAVADGAVARARAELEIAETAATRADALVREEAGSVRVRDEALSALAVARASLRTAEAQRALQGEPVAMLGRQGAYWLRVPVFAADFGRIDRKAPAAVQALGAGNQAHSARSVNAPPSANATIGTIDLYYEIGQSNGVFQVGQRVAVDLPVVGGAATAAVVPTSAILSDIYGGEWVYVRIAPQRYERRRIEVEMMKEGQALIRRGPDIGTQVVVAGAAELFGTEFGAK